MTCLWDGPLVVIFSLNLGLSLILLMTFWIVSIFLLGRFGKASLIFNVFIAMLWIKTQSVKSRSNSCIGVTQENSIEFLVQSSLPYILLLMVRACCCAPYPKWPCVWHEVNMCCPCCMMSLCSRTFYSILPSFVIRLVTTPSTCDLMWLRDWQNLTQAVSKNRKGKRKRKDNKLKEKKKWSPPSTILTCNVFRCDVVVSIWSWSLGIWLGNNGFVNFFEVFQYFFDFFVQFSWDR